MGGDKAGYDPALIYEKLKSTPPAWAGTTGGRGDDYSTKLKSTPPAWAGTYHH